MHNELITHSCQGEGAVKWRHSIAGALGLLLAFALLLAGPGAEPASASSHFTDYDTDDNGLIEVDSLAKLDAIRYDLDGDGIATATEYGTAFPDRKAAAPNAMGCPASGCIGYELTANLDFDTGTAGDRTDDQYYNGGSGWTPIGVDSTGAATAFTATFDGKGHTISNLFIDLNTSTAAGGGYVGLFGDSTGTITNVGLVNPSVTNTRAGASWSRTGALLARNNGAASTVSNSYVRGGSVTLTQGTAAASSGLVGCLVGYSEGTISDSWASCAVSASGANTDPTNSIVEAGGLVGRSIHTISGSYATGRVTFAGAIAGVVGGLAGSAESSVTSSYATGNVTSTSGAAQISGIGGLIGSTRFGISIKASYAAGNVSASGPNDYLGGLVGYLSLQAADVVQASYAAGNVSARGADNHIGGLIGRISPAADGLVQAVYARGAVSGNGAGSNAGGLVGSNASPDDFPMPVAANAYWDTETTGQNASIGGGQGQTTRGLQTPAGYGSQSADIYMTWNLNLDGTAGSDDPWHFGDRDQYPILKFGYNAIGIAHQRGADNVDYDSNDNNLIDVSRLAQLNAIRWDLDGNGAVADDDALNYALAFPGPAAGMGCPDGCEGYELTADLDFDTNGDGSITSADGAISYGAGGAGWVPVGIGGASGVAYTGRFDGNGHTIANMMINATDVLYLGLFGWANGGPIENVGLPGVDITANYPTGSIYPFSVGGLVGLLTGAVRGSYVTGKIAVDVTSTANIATSSVGGLVGRTIGDSVIAGSYATADISVTSTSTDTRPDIAGGLVGTLAGNAANQGSVFASYAAGAVSANRDGAEVGGLAGATGQVTIDASYATGRPTATGSGSQTGGLFGNLGSNATITASYWDADTSGVDDDEDADPPEGKTTLALWEPSGYTGIYAGWNVDVDGQAGGDDPWDFGNFCQYPALKYGSHLVSRQRAAADDDFPNNDVTFYSGQTVTLTAVNRGGTAYLWEQIRDADGPAVTLSDAGTAQATFMAPAGLDDAVELNFKLTLLADGVCRTDLVEVTILPAQPNELSDLTVTAGGTTRPLTPPFASSGRSFDTYVGAYTGRAEIAMAPADEEATVSFNGDDPVVGARTESVSLAEGHNRFTITVTPPEPDAPADGGDDAAEALEPVTYHLNIRRQRTPKLAFDPPAYLLMDEGETTTYTVELDTRWLGAEVIINISSDNPDITVSPEQVSISQYDWSERTITVTAADDADGEDDYATIRHIANGGHYNNVGGRLRGRGVG